jgi:Tol biopolymer transport system component
MPLATGDKFGPYEILAPIGEGGMGQVYRARDPRVGRDVAIKTSTEHFGERFEREARVIASLNHPNICHLYDVVLSKDAPNYLAMELVEGEAPRGPLPLDIAMNYARQIAAALDEAHEKGITHRDLKPANIKITPDGTVKVLDFGLAKVAPASVGVSEHSPTLSMTATQMGMILGTAAYMSPEQARGRPADRRADIWSFGVVLYEMLTGERLFRGEDITEVLASVVKEKPDLSKAPAELRLFLQRCLEKDPKKRLQALGDMDLLVGQGHALPVKGKSPRPWLWPSVAALLFVLSALVSFLHFREAPPERQVLQYTVALPGTTAVRHFALSPDGHYLAMTSDRLWVRALDFLQPQALAGTDGATYAFWSPDGRYIGFFADGKLKKISVNGGPSQAVSDAPNARGGAWSRDGVIVFAPLNTGGLSRVPAAGGVATPVTTAEAGFHRDPVFLADGRRFLYLAAQGKEDGIFVASLDSTENRRLILDKSKPEYFPPSAGNPVGHILFARDQTLMAQPIDPKTLEPRGDLFTVAEQVSRGANTGDNLFSLSLSGMLIYQTGGTSGGGQQQHLWFDRTGKELGAAGGVARTQNNFTLSPDGKRVAMERAAGESSRSDLWITDLEHATESRFTLDNSRNMYPVWSPDGAKIAFASNRGNAVFQLFQRASAGTGQDELVLGEPQEGKIPVDWSRDGRFLIFEQQSPKTGFDLWALPMTGDKKPIPLLTSEFNERQGQLSPDGRWLAYSSNESNKDEVYVQPFAPGHEKVTGKWQISLTGGTQPRWRGDGKELYYMAPDRKLMALEVKATAQTFAWGTPAALFESRSALDPGNGGYLPDRDGKRFLIVTAAGDRAEASPLTVVVNWLAGVKK